MFKKPSLRLANANVLLLGATGMIGRGVAALLAKKKAIVHSPTHDECNCCGTDDVYKYLSANHCDYVINCAGYNGGIKFNEIRPALIFERNTKIAINVIEACAATKVKKLVSLLTSCAYPPS